MSNIYTTTITKIPNLNQIRSAINPTIPINTINYNTSDNQNYFITITFVNDLTPINKTFLNDYFSNYISLPNQIISLSANGTYGNNAILECTLNNSDIVLTIPPVSDTIIVENANQPLNNKTINGDCNNITNINLATSTIGFLPVIRGGTGLSSFNGVIIGNGTDTPTTQTIGCGVADLCSPQELSGKIINANCNSITNVGGSFTGVLPVIQGGTGLSSFNGVLIGNNSSTPTVQTLSGVVVGTTDIQELSGKIINANCNSITNVGGSFTGVLPVIQGGTGLTNITPNGVMLGRGSSNPAIQVISGSIIDSNSSQTMQNKIMMANGNRTMALGSAPVTGFFPLFQPTDSLIIGYNAGKSLWGNYNVLLGSETGENMNLVNDIVAIGYRTLQNNSGNYCIGIGSNTLRNNTQWRNIGIGYSVMPNTTNSDNIGIGDQALNKNTNGIYNIGIGSNALYNNQSGANNIGIGNQALNNNNSGVSNIGIGSGALFNNIASHNIGIGNQALNSNNGGSNNIGIGSSALFLNLSGTDNVGIGYQSLNSNSTGIYNIGIGSYTLKSNNGSGNIAIGHQTLFNNNASGNIGIGFESLLNNTSGNENIAIGNNSLNSNINGTFNISIGTSSLQSNTGGNNNIAVGQQSLANNLTGVDNIAIGGYSTLNANTSGINNIALGSYSLAQNIFGNNNSGIGFRSLENNTADNNTALGYFSGRDLTSGSENTFIGTNTASDGTNTQYNKCTLIGYNSNTVNNNLTNATAIGADSLVSTSNTVVLGNNSAVVIGDTSEDTTAILKLESTTRGLLPPRLTTIQKNAIVNPTPGLMVYDTDLTEMCFYNGTTWRIIQSV